MILSYNVTNDKNKSRLIVKIIVASSNHEDIHVFMYKFFTYIC